MIASKCALLGLVDVARDRIGIERGRVDVEALAGLEQLAHQ
jgi:hypothetical protein